MGNRYFHKIEGFHAFDMPECERFKVTALNLFHPTASPLLQKVGSFVLRHSPAGERGRVRGNFRLDPAFLLFSILRIENNGKMIRRLQVGNVNFEATCAMIGILIPMDVAVGEIIEGGMSECNKTGEFIFLDC